MSRAIRVSALAREAKIDDDVALLALWDEGFLEELDSPEDIIRSRRVAEARAVLKIVSPKEQTKINYWLTQLDISREEFSNILSEMGIILTKDARKLPKGALRKLRRQFPQYEEINLSSKLEPVPDTAVISGYPSMDPSPPFKWRIVGTVRQIQYVTEEEVVSIHNALVQDFEADNDPISPSGVRDYNLLSSALERPQTGMTNERKYPTIEMAGAALLHSIVLNHAFYNGNKRTALVSLLVFLDKNSLMPECTEDDLFKLTLRLAQHRLVPQNFDNLADREVIEIADWIRQHSRRISKEEHPLQWLKLKRILRKYMCEFEPVKGGSLNLLRMVDKRRLGRTRKHVLRTQVAFRGDKTEVEPSVIRHIRTKLELDENNGVDSIVFYNAGNKPDDFIQRYRTLLRRLARL